MVICEALVAMLEDPDLSVRTYWRVLNEKGVTAQRMASFDRSIRSEPRFSRAQAPGLLRDLRAYLITLQVSKHPPVMSRHVMSCR